MPRTVTIARTFIAIALPRRRVGIVSVRVLVFDRSIRAMNYELTWLVCFGRALPAYYHRIFVVVRVELKAGKFQFPAPTPKAPPGTRFSPRAPSVQPSCDGTFDRTLLDSAPCRDVSGIAIPARSTRRPLPNRPPSDSRIARPS